MNWDLVRVALVGLRTIGPGWDPLSVMYCTTAVTGENAVSMVLTCWMTSSAN